MLDLGLGRAERVAVYLPKRFETVVAFFGTSLAGGVFVPVNPLLKAEQVGHILRDCNVRVLVTSPERLSDLDAVLAACPGPARHRDRRRAAPLPRAPAGKKLVGWTRARSMRRRRAGHRVIDTDMAAILYTSGSTGKPKGVVLSHRNMVAGAKSVAEYLANVPDDRMLAALPLRFDSGFSQLTTAFLAGAQRRAASTISSHAT